MMDARRKKYINSCEVSTVESAVLGGYRQKFAIEGRRKDLPVVICLHGGPGSPIPFSVGARGLFPEITDRLIMVYWDQLGCGANHHKIDNTFTVEHFVRMTVDLIGEIKRRFPENRIYLFGMSWGSVLALYAATKAAKMIDGVVVWGQVIESPLRSAGAMDEIDHSSAPPKKKALARRIRAHNPNLTWDDFRAYLKIVGGYTDGFYHRAAEPLPRREIVKGILTSPDYRLRDKLSILRNGYGKNSSLMREMSGANLREMLARVTVPYRIYQGETDLITGTKEVEEFMMGSKNANLSCTVLPGEGHFPSVRSMNVLLQDAFRMA